MPSGKPKTMAVDLTGKFLSASREVRIVTNLCVYWDEIYLVEDNAPPASAHDRACPWTPADLHFRGFSQATDRSRSASSRSSSITELSAPLPCGIPRPAITRATARCETSGRTGRPHGGHGFGRRDSHAFRAAGLPPLPAGWKRDFLLLVDGWAKDADANTAFSQSVLPLPFHAMSRYPYPPANTIPHDAAHAQYQREYLTRPALRLIRPLQPVRAVE